MNFFLRNRVIIWILGGLLIITLSILGSMIYHNCTEPEEDISRPGCASSCEMLSGKLELDPAQHKQMEQILDHFRDSSSALVAELRQRRLALMEVLESETPDTMRIMTLAEEIGVSQARLTRLAANQYLHIRSICDPDQKQALSDLYCDLFGCPRVGMTPDHSQDTDQVRHRHQNRKARN